MKKAKEYSNKYYHSWIDNGGDSSHYAMHVSEFNKAIEISYLEGKLSMCKIGHNDNGPTYEMAEIINKLEKLTNDRI